jgi:hypothetical protein
VRVTHQLAILAAYAQVSNWHEAPLLLSILGMAGIGGTADRDLRSQKLGRAAEFDPRQTS